MSKEKKFLTLDEVEAYTGIKKGSLYYYFRTLGIETHKFNLDKRAYISFDDANRIKEVKDTPWMAGEKISQKAEKQPAQEKVIDNTTKPIKRAQKSTTEETSSIPLHLPQGTLSSSQFAKKHGIYYTDLKNYMRRGIEGKKFEVTEESHPTRKGYTLKFLTPEQQEQALEMLKRHGKLK